MMSQCVNTTKVTCAEMMRINNSCERPYVTVFNWLIVIKIILIVILIVIPIIILIGIHSHSNNHCKNCNCTFKPYIVSFKAYNINIMA